MLATNLTTGTQAIWCLNEGNRFRLYMINAAGPEELNETSRCCIWNAMARLLDLDEPHTDVPSDFDLMGQMMTMMMAMPLYRAATHQPDLESEELGFGEEEANYIVCAIDAAGGRQASINTFREDGADFQVFLQAEEPCRPPTPQP